MYVNVKNRFNEADWEFTFRDSLIYLTGYIGSDTHVVFPSGDNYRLGGMNGEFRWGSASNFIESIDFNGIKVTNEQFPMASLYNIPVKEVKGFGSNFTNVNDLFRDSNTINKVYFNDNVTKCDRTFESSMISEAVPIHGTFNTMDRTYADCKKLSKGKPIPKAVQRLIRTYTCSGIEQGVDLSNNGILSMEDTYNTCVFLESTGKFSDSTIIMDGTYRNCYRLREVSTLPANLRFMVTTFENCKKLRTNPVLPKNLKDLTSAFSGTSIAYAKEIPYGVLSTLRMYYSCIRLIKGADVPDSVICTSFMYDGCVKLKRGVNIGRSVVASRGMYENCEALVYSPDLPNNIKLADYMFARCISLKNAPNIGKVVSCNNMFEDCIQLTTAPEIPESVEYMRGMFKGCRALGGDIIIKSKNIKDAREAFSVGDIKRVHIYFNSRTYKAFEEAGLTNHPELCNIELVPLDEE